MPTSICIHRRRFVFKALTSLRAVGGARVEYDTRNARQVPSGPRARPFHLGMPQEEVSFRTMPAIEAQQPSLETPFFKIALLARRLPARPSPVGAVARNETSLTLSRIMVAAKSFLAERVKRPEIAAKNSGALSAHSVR